MTWQQGRITASIAGCAVLISSAISLTFLENPDTRRNADHREHNASAEVAAAPRQLPRGEVSRLPAPESGSSSFAADAVLPPIPLIARADARDLIAPIQDRLTAGGGSDELSGPRFPVPQDSGPRLSRLPQEASAAPAKLPSAGDASPILNDLLPPLAHDPDKGSDSPAAQNNRSNPAWEAAIRELIRQELPEADAQEQEVWLDELKTVPPGMMRELLRMRQKVGSAAPTLMGPLPDLGLAPLTTPDAVPWTPETPLPGDSDASDEGPHHFIHSSLTALEKATQVLLNNIANARTPGFKRTRILLSDRPVADAEAGRGVQLAATRIDVTPGKLTRTDQPLDVAVDGAGFLQFSRNGIVLYTRSGSLAISADGQLCLAHDGEEILLEPAISVPPEATGIVIAENGIVSWTDKDEPENVAAVPVSGVDSGEDTEAASAEEAADHQEDTGVPAKSASSTKVLGQIMLARFTDATALRPVGDNLLAETARSGKPFLGNPGTGGLGQLRQHHLEDSNVILSEEVRRIRELREIAETLRTLTAE